MRKSDSTQKVPLSFKRALLVATASLALGILWDILFYDKLVGISFPIFIVVGLATALVSARAGRVSIPRPALLMAIPLLFFSVMIFVRADGFIAFLDSIASLYLVLLCLYMVYRPDLHLYVLRDYVALPFRQVAAYAAHARSTLATVAGVRSFVRKHEHFPHIVRGIVIAVPVLLLFIALFSSADLVFRHYAADLFNIHIDGNFLRQALLCLIVAFMACGALTYLLRPSLTGAPARSGETSKGFALGRVEMAILFGSLNVLFVLFIVVQLAYLFGGERNVLGQGFTYAEYARKGFFELIAVAVVSFLLLWFAEKSSQRLAARHPRPFQWLSAALIVQVLVIMVSAFKRLALYENAYGFTDLRFYSHVAIIWLAVVFCFLLYKILRSAPEYTFARLLFFSALAALVFVNVVNVDAFVARKNIARYQATHKLDVQYIQSLSDDAIPATVQLLHAPDPHLRTAYAGVLYAKQQRLISKEHAWQSKNLGREAALRILNEQGDVLRQNRDQRLEYIVSPVYTSPASDPSQ